MAECAYARCIQERRLIKRELMKWSKDMLHIVGLERVAEELVGRRKWKHYQDSLTRAHLSTDQLTATIDQLNIETQKATVQSELKQDIKNCSIKSEQHIAADLEELKEQIQGQQSHEENHRQKEDEEEVEAAIKLNQKQAYKVDITTIKAEEEEGNNKSPTKTSHKNIYNNNNNNNTSVKSEESITRENLTSESRNCDKITNLRLLRLTTTPDEEDSSISTPPPPEPIDWKPNEKCYFCIDGKLLTVNSKGELVAESGPALSEADHAQRQLIDSDSDSNDSRVGANNSTSANSLSVKSGTGGTAGNQRVNVNKLLASRLRDLPMTSMNPMAAQLAAIQSISGQLYPNFHWLQQLQQQQEQNNSATPTTSDTSAAAVSPAPKDSPSPSDATGEQPLDLSSKPSPNSSISGDLKSSSNRSKTSRSTPIPIGGRRTYTDDDLNSALQDIISGKLGTRKASVCYNIPRSTLRNKVYKLTTDAKRTNSSATAELLQLQQALELEKDLSGEEGEESNASTPQPETYDDLATATLRKLCENSSRQEDVSVDKNSTCSPKIAATTLISALSDQLKLKSSAPLSGGTQSLPSEPSPQPQIPPILIDPNLFLQTLLLSTGALQNPAALQPRLDETVTLRDLVGAILLNSSVNLKDIFGNASAGNAPSNTADTLNNGSGKSNNVSDQRLLLQQLQQQQQHPISGQLQQSSPSTSAHYTHRLPKSDTPETNSSLDPNETNDDLPVILKIPPYKPAAGSSTSVSGAVQLVQTSSSAISPSLHCSNNSNSNRNGDSPHSQHSAQSPRIATSILAAAVAAASGNKNNAAVHHQSNNNISVISPPVMGTADSQSPPSFSLREVFANSIQRTMNEQANKDSHAAMLGLGVDSERSAPNDYKKPSISVVKNIGGTDTSRFGEAPNLLTGVGSSHNSYHHHHHPHLSHQGQHHHNSSLHLSRQEAAALAAGKGTRPKRGKYRNYDRDSLVEAVKAVQRGEMSVHRAGSYYGVPHSTLEYKVKERHLMRPRKREPKPQPLDGSSTSSSASKNNSNIPALDRTTNNLDKMPKANPSAGATKISGGTLKNNANPAFQSNSPNGMKLSMFDQSVTAAQLQYAPHLFWQHSPFGPLQMDFNRATTQGGAIGIGANAQAASASAAGSALPYVNAEILKSHMRYQEKSMRNAPGATGSSHKSGRPSPIASPMSGQNHHALSYKGPHDLAAENGGGFLEGIIRQRLDRKSNDVAPPPVSDALLGQLLTKKTPLPFTNNRGNADYASSNISTTSSTSSANITQLKRSGSPLMPYGCVDIKRERGSPMHSDMEDASISETDDHTEHNNNNPLLNSDKLERTVRHALERTRMSSRDSDTDGGSSNGGSLKSGHLSMTNEQMIPSQHYNNSSSDLNGAGVPLKVEASGTTSILQEKLGQIKAEQEGEENL